MYRFAFAIAVIFTAVLIGCGGDDKKIQSTPQEKQEKDIKAQAEKLEPFTPKNHVDFNNFNRAQRLYDDPNTIQWCTTTWANPSAPIITFPVAGKMTSSSVSYRSPDAVVRADMPGDGMGPVPFALGAAVSSDGVFHGNPPPYRYGFTPGGIYNDVSEMPMFCTTALTKFQREATALSVAIDQQANSATNEAEAALKRGDKAAAQRALDKLEGK